VSAARSGRIGVTIVSGFLGSGKTTLLRASLSGDASTAVIVNEFGDVALDHLLLRSCEERVEVVSGGCACCARRADLVEVLRALLDDHDRGRVELRRVVIETSGLADPAPIVATIGADPMLRHHFVVERLTVCVDAVNGLAALARGGSAVKQVAIADEIVITKLDLAAPDDCVALAARLNELNPRAARACARHGARDAGLPAAFEPRGVPARPPVPAGAVGAPAAHTEDVRGTVLQPERDTDWLGFSVWLSMLLAARGDRVLRVKGLIELEGGSTVSINGVQHTLHEPEHFAAGEVPAGNAGIVLITRGIDGAALTESFEVFQRIARRTLPAGV